MPDCGWVNRAGRAMVRPRDASILGAPVHYARCRSPLTSSSFAAQRDGPGVGLARPSFRPGLSVNSSAASTRRSWRSKGHVRVRGWLRRASLAARRSPPYAGEDLPVAAVPTPSGYPAGAVDEAPPQSWSNRRPVGPTGHPAAPSQHTAEALLELRMRVRAVITRLGADLQEGAAGTRAICADAQSLSSTRELMVLALPNDQRALVAQQVDDTLGLGPSSRCCRDESGVDEIIVGTGTAYIERDGLVQSSPASIHRREHLHIDRDRGSGWSTHRRGITDGRCATIGWLQSTRLQHRSRSTATLTIRKFNRRALSMDDLIG